MSEHDTDADAPGEHREPKPFAGFLHEYQYGQLHDELSEALQELVNEVREAGLKGKLTLDVEVKPSKGDQLEVLCSIKRKHPEPSYPPQAMWPDRHGSLSLRDPRQQMIDLRTIDDPSDPREV